MVDCFRNGFSIGYEGKEDVKIASPNLKFREVGNPTELWNKDMNEVKEGTLLDHLMKYPFKNYFQSPIVPKERLIFHLSYPRGKGTSVNENTPKDKCIEFVCIRYPDFNEAIQMCVKQGKNCNIAKSDIKSPFRNLGIKKTGHFQ